MSCFVDTSALYAVLDAADGNHSRAAKEWRAILGNDEVMVVTNYIQVETVALVQRRLGMSATRAFLEDVVPLLTVEWIHDEIYMAGVSAMLGAQLRDLSLVDCVSFEVMRRLGLRDVFTFDVHFAEQGFLVRPLPGQRGHGVAESRAEYGGKVRKARRSRRSLP